MICILLETVPYPLPTIAGTFKSMILLWWDMCSPSLGWRVATNDALIQFFVLATQLSILVDWRGALSSQPHGSFVSRVSRPPLKKKWHFWRGIPVPKNVTIILVVTVTWMGSHPHAIILCLDIIDRIRSVSPFLRTVKLNKNPLLKDNSGGIGRLLNLPKNRRLCKESTLPKNKEFAPETRRSCGSADAFLLGVHTRLNGYVKLLGSR